MAEIFEAPQAYDDRLDTDVDISSAQAARLLLRTLEMMGEVKHLVAATFGLGIVRWFMLLYMPWIAKIVVDQVLLQKPFGTTDVRFPPFMDPILAATAGLEPMGIMLVITLIYFVLLVLFGLRGPEEGDPPVAQGTDAASQSENAVSTNGNFRGGLLGILEMHVHVRMVQRLSNSMRQRLFAQLTHLPMASLEDQRVGDSVYRVMHDTSQLPGIYAQLWIIPFFALLGGFAALWMMGYSYGDVAPEIVWISWAMLPIGMIIAFPLSRLVRRTNHAKRAAGAASTNALEETMSNIGAVQSLGGFDRERDRFKSRVDESLLRERYAFLVGIGMFVIGPGSLLFASAWVKVLITDEIIEGRLTPGDLAVLLGLYWQLGEAAMNIGTFWIKVQGNTAALRRVYFYIDYVDENEPQGTRPIDGVNDGVRFRDVSFAYADGQRALDHVNLELSTGELVAVVGPTGARKTTLAYMIPGFLTPTTGRVEIDGIDVTDLDLDGLRAQVSYVFQEHFFLAETIRENLLLANRSASEADLQRALETAGCLEFLDGLPNGLDTVLGRGGDTLSVGQQQRLSIARGLIRDTPILILDEPTAALDPRTENALVSALERAKTNRLVVVIAHRLSTIRRADRIVFLEDGAVADVGSHEALMQDPDGRYRNFVELQGA